MSGKFDVFALFPTPIVHFEVPGSAVLTPLDRLEDFWLDPHRQSSLS